jgi:FtsP/CotA-like multicopper oxidase with cupredoxin domain
MRKDKIKKKFEMKMTRRQVLKAGLYGGAALMLPWRFQLRKAHAVTLVPGLSDPASQPKFAEIVPNALDPGFIFDTGDSEIRVGVGQAEQYTGLVGTNGTKVKTTVWGYGQVTGSAKNPRVPGLGYTWPGRTFQVRSNEPLEVRWENRLGTLTMPVTSFGRPVIDTSLHWVYSLPGYDNFSVDINGVPIVPHVHGGHTDFQFDGNPEFFFTEDWIVRGPQWVEKPYVYKNDQPAGTVWYHDHALGITRLNVYAGMAGFYIIRDSGDTGLSDNPLGLPAYPYEVALAIQDKMFHDDGRLFYPAYPGDPFYVDFIEGEGADLSAGDPNYFGSFNNPIGDPDDPNYLPRVGYGPTGLAEFFGDHMVVNGKIWPKMNVEPRNYRLRLLNGCDSRFLVAQFFAVPNGVSTDEGGNNVQEIPADAIGPLDFTVIGSDQGLTSEPKTVKTVVMETGSRYDVIFNFGQAEIPFGSRVIMKNIGGDTPFGFSYGDDLEIEDVFPDRQTDRIMAFDVVNSMSGEDLTPTGDGLKNVLKDYADSREGNFPGYNLTDSPDRIRNVALFEGTDEYGRLQPLLGTAEPATDYMGNQINWPNTTAYNDAGLSGQMEGAIAWHSPTTENPALGALEEWHVWNVTGDSHPVHLHLVHFDVVGRQKIKWHDDKEGITFEPGEEPETPTGTYLVTQSVVQHNGEVGNGFRIANKTTEGPIFIAEEEYVDQDLPKDMVTARPSEVTIIRAKFDKPGRYVWHCHILSHEDHEMMRVLFVGEGTTALMSGHPAPAY